LQLPSVDQLKRRTTLRVRKTFFRTALSDSFVRLIDRNKPVMSLGSRGELAAERFLLKQGYWIIARGVGEKTGEIDLIVSDGKSIIFVEVKTRSSDNSGDPTEAVDEAKQRHISQTARLYAVKNGLEDAPMRFDVISIVWPDLEKPPKIAHYKSAFEAIGDFQMF